MSWSAKRQLIYGSSVLVFLLIVIGVPVYLKFFNKAPTCFDGIMNQTERGPDCGGTCSKACADEVIADPLVHWARIFPVVGSNYNLVAYVENPNILYFGAQTRYKFRVFDKDNMLIGEVNNQIGIPPINNFAIFVPGFDAKERVPDHVTFEFTDKVVWLRYAGYKAELSVNGKSLTNLNTIPRLDVIISNKTVEQFKDIEVVALLYDKVGNAINASRTFIDSLSDQQSQKITFTWPEPFNSDVSTIEIIPVVPFESR